MPQHAAGVVVCANTVGEVRSRVRERVLVHAGVDALEHGPKVGAERDAGSCRDHDVPDVQRAENRIVGTEQSLTAQIAVRDLLDPPAEQIIGVAARLQ